MERIIQLVLAIYLLSSACGFLLMARDKAFARKKQWRTPEAWFFYLALAGGSLGVWLGMRLFRHKTKHKTFVYGIPALFVVNIAVLALVFFKL